MKTALLTGILVSLTSVLLIVVIAVVVTLSPNTGGAPDYRSHIIDNIKVANIDEFLRNLTTYPHPAGSERNLDIAKTIQEKWLEHGLKQVELVPYSVLLAKSDPGLTNYFQILDASGKELHKSTPTQPQVDEFPQEEQDQILAFNAFSSNGIVNRSDVMYAHYGTENDFKNLEDHGFSVNNSIVIIRYGQVFRGDKVRHAAKRGAVGVILYTDPADAAPLKGPNTTYPYTKYAPGGGIQLGSLVSQGDLLTPGYPATEDAFRIPKEEADILQIPVQPVGYDDAFQIISRLSGDLASDLGWGGGLNVTYRIGGPLLDETILKMSVSNNNSRSTIYNVIGFLPGEEEQDRYVMLGNHHDAWGYGGIDPSAGTANMLELTRVFGKMYEDGWRPRRSLLFCSWDAEEYGDIGSTEYAEHFKTALKAQAVVYLNVDRVMTGNYSFDAAGLPHLSDIIFRVSQLVPNPDYLEVEEGRKYVYDTWVSRNAGELEPELGALGAASDYMALVFNLGIPTLDFTFIKGPNEKSLPLYHMAYETYEMTTELVDVGLQYHLASARIWGLLAFEFSTKYALPVNTRRLSDFVQESLTNFKQTNEGKLKQLNITMDTVDKAAEKLSSATETFWKNIQEAELNDEMTLRRYNDAVMLMDKSFLAPRGLPHRPLLNHVLIAPNATNCYTWETFPGLQDYLREMTVLGINETRRGFEEHMAAVAYHINAAANVLTFTLW